MSDVDSTADTLKHAQRVGALMGQPIRELVTRSAVHDHSKTCEPEKAVFDEFTAKLQHTTYGSDEYKSHLAAMKPALDHHYAHNRHHPEHFGAAGITGMTLVDLIEMLADWKAATERHADGDLKRSLTIQKDRFAISGQLAAILDNTARWFGWLLCGAEHTTADGARLRCNLPDRPHTSHCDGRYEPYDWPNTQSPRSAPRADTNPLA